MRISIVICSLDRPAAIAAILPSLLNQSKPASEIVFVVTKPEDLPDETALEQTGDVPLKVLFSEKGLCRQRNRGLDEVQDRCDAVFFIDDDYMPGRDALAGIERGFGAFPAAGGLTGHLLADGIHTGGIAFDVAADLIAEYENNGHRPPIEIKRDLVGLYGCNMAYRCDRIGQIRFDERLPLYGWQEDVDFASRVPGEMVKTGAFFGVHCGTRDGREVNGALLGYSQVANVSYLLRKGSLPARFALKLMARNVLSNHMGLLKRHSWIDRKGRARGNRLALLDLLRGVAKPERILELSKSL